MSGWSACRCGSAETEHGDRAAPPWRVVSSIAGVGLFSIWPATRWTFWIFYWADRTRRGSGRQSGRSVPSRGHRHRPFRLSIGCAWQRHLVLHHRRSRRPRRDRGQPWVGQLRHVCQPPDHADQRRPALHLRDSAPPTHSTTADPKRRRCPTWRRPLSQHRDHRGPHVVGDGSTARISAKDRIGRTLKQILRNWSRWRVEQLEALHAHAYPPVFPLLARDFTVRRVRSPR